VKLWESVSGKFFELKPRYGSILKTCGVIKIKHKYLVSLHSLREYLE
jgi:hypothetical protein